MKHEMNIGYTYYGYDNNGSLTALQEPSGTTYFEYGDHGLCERIVPAGG